MNRYGVDEKVLAERYLYLLAVGFVWVAELGWHGRAGRLRV